MLTEPPCSAEAGLTEVITGFCNIVKLVVVVAVEEATVTEIAPVVAPDGTVTVRVLPVAAVTVAAVPLNSTVSALGVVLKFWPWMVTVVPTPPCWGVKLKIASEPGGGLDDVAIESMFPISSYV